MESQILRANRPESVMKTRSIIIIFLALVSSVTTLALLQASSPQRKHVIKKQAFGTVPEGPVDFYIMTNSRGMDVRAMNYGGIIVSLRVPDKKGVLADVVLGFDALDGYLNNKPYFGAIIGRYANRIRQREVRYGEPPTPAFSDPHYWS